MKKIILLFVLTILCLAAASSVQAYTTGGAKFGQFMVGTNQENSTLSVSLSSNVYLYYNGASQTYGAATKNKAGDKQYATGGGPSADSGIYYKIDTAVGVGSTNITDPTNAFVKSAGWTAQ